MIKLLNDLIYLLVKFLNFMLWNFKNLPISKEVVFQTISQINDILNAIQKIYDYKNRKLKK